MTWARFRKRDKSLSTVPKYYTYNDYDEYLEFSLLVIFYLVCVNHQWNNAPCLELGARDRERLG